MNRPALEPGDTLDGFVIGRVLHAGSMARIFTVHYAQGTRDPGFPMVMKVPRMGARDGPETIVGFETEHRLLPLLTGPHVPRFVACGDLAVNPYLVMEQMPGRTYQELLDQTPRLNWTWPSRWALRWRGPATACIGKTWCMKTSNQPT